jgi:hypothetical protein
MTTPVPDLFAPIDPALLRAKLAAHLAADVLERYLQQAQKMKVTEAQAKAFLENVEPQASAAGSGAASTPKTGCPSSISARRGRRA